MDVSAPLIPDGEAAKAVQPCQCPLDDPAMSAQSFAAVYTSPGNAGLNPALPAFAPAAAMVIGLVGVELVGPLARTATTVAHARHSVESGCQHHAVVPVGRAQPHPERGAPPVDHKMALRARFAAIRWVRAGLGSPLFRGNGGAIKGCATPVRLSHIRKALQKNAVKLWSRRRLPASHAACASRSCRSSQTHAAASPRECRIAGQR